jgi:hypothetical protein
MNNPETQATLDARHKTNTNKTNKNNTTQKTKKISNTDPTENLIASKG